MTEYANEWQRCRPWIEAALELAGGTHTIEDVEADLAKGHVQFWPATQSAAVTRVAEFPRAKWLNIWLAGGDLDELVGMIPTWQSFASFHGCRGLTLTGREGWKRVLGKLGWQTRAVTLALPLAESKG